MPIRRSISFKKLLRRRSFYRSKERLDEKEEDEIKSDIKTRCQPQLDDEAEIILTELLRESKSLNSRF